MRCNLSLRVAGRAETGTHRLLLGGPPTS